MNEGYKFKEENFEVGYWTNNSPVNLGDSGIKTTNLKKKISKMVTVTGPTIHLHLG